MSSSSTTTGTSSSTTTGTSDNKNKTRGLNSIYHADNCPAILHDSRYLTSYEPKDVQYKNFLQNNLKIEDPKLHEIQNGTLSLSSSRFAENAQAVDNDSEYVTHEFKDISKNFNCDKDPHGSVNTLLSDDPDWKSNLLATNKQFYGCPISYDHGSRRPQDLTETERPEDSTGERCYGFLGDGTIVNKRNENDFGTVEKNHFKQYFNQKPDQSTFDKLVSQSGSLRDEIITDEVDAQFKTSYYFDGVPDIRKQFGGSIVNQITTSAPK